MISPFRLEDVKNFTRRWQVTLEQINRMLGTIAGIAWNQVSKSGSQLTDIETRPHSMLQAIEGTGTRHITSGENSEITAIDGLSAGMVAKTEDATYSARTITAPAAGITVTNGDGTSGNPTLTLANDLAAVEGLSSTGLAARTATDTWAVRTITGTDGAITVTNGNGVSENPVIDLQEVYNDLNMPVTSLAPGATAPGNFTIPGTGLVIKSFTGTAAAQSAHGTLEILHDYKEGSDIIPHIHWCPTTTGAGDVKWQLEYSWANGGGTITTSTTISATATVSGTVANEQRLNFPTITGTGKTIGSRFVYRLFRDPADGADTYAADAGAFDFGIHYLMDTVGSRQVTTK